MNPEALSTAPESLLAGLAKTHDRQAFQELVRRRQSWLRNFLRRQAGDPDIADDLAQQTFLLAWRDISKLRSASKFAPWLRQIALNTWRQYLRQNKLPTVNEEVDVAGDDGQRPAMAMDLDAALQQLSEHERSCIVLSYHEGMSHSEISDTLGMPLGTVKSHIRRGTEVLRSILDQESSNE